MIFYNPNTDLVSYNVNTKFCLILSIHSQDIEQNRVLTSIKGGNPVANLRKMTFYNPNVDIVNDDVYTNLLSFCLFII